MTRLSLLGLVCLAAACSDPEVDPETNDGGGGDGGAPTSTDASSSSSQMGGMEATGGSGGDVVVGGAGGAGGDGGQPGEGGSGGSGPICDPYPVPLSVPDAQPAALAELQSFAPDANLSWSAAHGTLSLVTNLGVTLDCSSNDVWAAAWSFFAEHPDLFQLDASEWPTEPTFPCSAVTSSSIVSTYRQELAGESVQKDVLSIFVAPVDGQVRLTAVSAFYLPPLGPEAIEDCAELPDAELESIIRQGSYTFNTYSFCAPTGSGSYQPQPGDVVEIDTSHWQWEDPPQGLTAKKLLPARLIIDESHWTEQLLASDANCPDATGDERILGFTLLLDPVTGAIVDVKPGIGCIVC